MNYFDFKKVMDTRNLSTTEATMHKMLDEMESFISLVSRLVTQIEKQKEINERLQHQIDMVYCDLAPEAELIEEMADGDATKREELFEVYRYKGGDYICDLYTHTMEQK